MGTRPDSCLAWLDAVKGTHAGEFLLAAAVDAAPTSRCGRFAAIAWVATRRAQASAACDFNDPVYASPSTERTLNTSVRSQTGLSVSSIPKGIPI